MGAWIDGFWQVLIEDDDEDIQPTPRTTIAVRASGCCVYAGGHYMQFRAEKRRRPLATSLPLSDEDAVAMFRSHRATAGTFDVEQRGAETIVTHKPSIAVDPRHLDPFEVSVAVVDDDTVEARGPGTTEQWRRLSGRGTTPLAGAWEIADGEERYLYLVTQGHYGVMRTPVAPSGPSARLRADPQATLTKADEVELFNGTSINAGAHLLATRTFDHWPMFASFYGYEVNKHPSFWIALVTDAELRISFDPSDPNTPPWRRVG